MSAQFVVKFNDRPVRFHNLGLSRPGRRAELVPQEEASIFTSEAEGWAAAHQSNLKPAGLITVEPV